MNFPCFDPSLSSCCENSLVPINQNVIPPLSLGRSPISAIPEEFPEIFSVIFSYINSSSYRNGCLVNKSWSKLAMDPSFVKSVVKNIIEYTRVFGNSQWKQHSGQEIVKNEDMAEESKSLSLFQDDIVKSSVLGKKLGDMLDGGLFVRMAEDLTLENIGALVKLKLPGSWFNGYQAFSPPEKQEHAGGSYWLWSSTTRIKDSGNKSYPVQRKMAAELGYQDSHAREVAACLFAEFSLSGTFLCDDWYARCLDTRLGYQIIVGFGQSGLGVDSHDFSGNDSFIAVLGVLRWRPVEVRSSVLGR